MNQYNDNYLAHYGIKGMKWGKRKNPKDAPNKNYTSKQRKRDRSFYGPKGVKRINRRLNEGESLQGARHYEVERRDKAIKRQKVVKRGAKKAATALSAIGSVFLYDQIYLDGIITKTVAHSVSKVLKKTGNTKMSDLNSHYSPDRLKTWKAEISTSDMRDTVISDTIDNIIPPRHGD